MFEALKENKRLWDLFTKKEEYNPLILDRYQRFDYYLSRSRNVFEPEVSNFLIQNGLRVEYPNSKRFAVCLTHDIDAAYFTKMYLAKEAALSLRKLQISKFLGILLNNVSKKRNRLWNFEQIMNLEKKYEAKSSFYFLALDGDDQGFNYKIEELKAELRNIVDNGWEVGLHGAHEAYNSLNRIKREKERLEDAVGKEVIGYRNHYLGFKLPTTWKLLKEAGFKYDTTLGYIDCAGFRNGMCHPFKPFDLNTNSFIDILEIPLTIMDGTLLDDDNMRLDMKNAWTITKRLIDSVEKNKGVITILWHNKNMCNETLMFYEEILRYCNERNAWMTSGEEIWRWWNKNNFLEGS